MTLRTRAKGVRGEREVLELFEAHGFTVRGLESGGDHLALGHGMVWHVETKRHETARPWAWLAQARADAPPATVPIVAFRRSHSRWVALVDLEELLVELEELARREPTPA